MSREGLKRLLEEYSVQDQAHFPVCQSRRSIAGPFSGLSIILLSEHPSGEAFYGPCRFWTATSSII
jgi:hypothetical protein